MLSFRAPRLLTAAAVLAGIVWAATIAGAATTDDWPMFGRNKEHHGRSLETVIGAANASSLKLAWRTNTGAAVQSSPVVAFNAVRGQRLVYIGNSVGLVQAFDAITGARVWTYNAGYNVNSTPAVYNGTVYITSESRVIALDGATGAEKGVFNGTGYIIASPLVVAPDDAGPDAGFGGVDNGGRVYAIRADNCQLRWEFNGFNTG